VEGRPLLLLAGELGNSSASSLGYLEPHWETFRKLHLNTLLAPVYWELMEPAEGSFDFGLVDGLVAEARRRELKLVLLWFASWKNSMSCYAPAWVKTDPERFPRARQGDGTPLEIVSPFSDQGRDADARAFAALMRHLRDVDAEHQTVVMVQVENEIGMIPEARDRSADADELFGRAVPEELLEYLEARRGTLAPELAEIWRSPGAGSSGTWSDVFGGGAAAEEIFMAWHFGRYVEAVTAAGKAEYPLPMFVNAALPREGYVPGQYPSAGPLPHLIDVWRAAAPSVDFLAPDIYRTNFAEWCARYDRSGNPLFIPEAHADRNAAAHAFYAIGAHRALGFSPFSIEHVTDPDHLLGPAYALLSALTPTILEHQREGTLRGALVDQESPEQTLELSGYRMKVRHDYTWGWAEKGPEGEAWPRAGALLAATGADAFLIAGTGVIVTFESATDDGRVGILRAREQGLVGGELVPGRWLNGDQTHQGRHIRIPAGRVGLQRFELYRYR
jgi:beta-galactosidase GanA